MNVEGCDENPVQTMNINMNGEIWDDEENADTITLVKSELCTMCDNEEGATLWLRRWHWQHLRVWLIDRLP